MMTDAPARHAQKPDSPSRGRAFSAIRRSFRQFLTLPLLVVLGFIVLGFLVYEADLAWARGTAHRMQWLSDILGDSQALGELLSTVASGIITVTSITFSLLLIALQQGASALTTHVTDQFLMRRTNQFYFGFFVGLSIFVLQTLVTVSEDHRPIFGAAIALLLTAVALCMIVVMIYNTIDQMRPGQIVDAIRVHVLHARGLETRFLAKTRRAPRADFARLDVLRARQCGHLAAFQIAPLRKLITEEFSDSVEVELRVRIGTYVAHNDPLAVLRLREGTTIGKDAVERLNEAVCAALIIDNDRDLHGDPRYGIYQLSTIAWTAISTAKSNPSPGRDVINAIRDIVARWSAEADEVGEDPRSSIVYPDNTAMEAVNVLEMAILVSSESLQAQTLTDALHTLTMLLDEAPQPLAERLADIADRGLSSLGEHVLTRDLARALDDLGEALRARGFGEVADRTAAATRAFATTIGHLHSRSTRVPGA